MNVWGLGLVIGALAASAFAFLWVAIRLGNNPQTGKPRSAADKRNAIGEAVDADTESIFNDEFREELRNRGRLHFEKIIGENAMFLQQDLRLTTSQINEYMKQEITKTLQEEFAKYEQSIEDAKKQAMDAMQKTQVALEEERQVLRTKLNQEVDAQRERLIKRFEENMGEIVNHYVLDAIGNEIDLSDQLEYILGELQSNKETIVEDIRSGA
jgi:F0F1-type ATP synthase membrane subunit b/b'